MSIRTKIVLAIVASGLMAAIVVVVPMLVGMQRLIDQGASKELANFRLRLEEAVNARVEQAIETASLVAAMPQVGQAMARGDRQALAEMYLPGFAKMKDRHGIQQFQFHDMASHSFYRVHKPEQFGDDLSGFRKTVVQSNATGEEVAGIERGRAGLGVRGVAPVMYGDRQVGTVEIGLSLGAAFFDGLVKDSESNIEFYLLPDREVAGFEAQKVGPERISASFDAPPLVDAAEVMSAETEPRMLGFMEFMGGDQASALYPVADFSGKTVGVIHVLVPLEKYMLVVRNMQMLALGAAAIALLVAFGVAWIFGGRISAALLDLIEKLGRLADGDAETRIGIAEKRSGELGLMAQGLVTFRDKLIETKALQAEREAQEAQQGVVVAELARALSRLSHGDLSTRIETDLGDGYRQLAEDFNAAMVSLGEVIRSIAESAGSIAMVVEEIRSAAHDLSHRTESSAATLEESSAALSDLTDAVHTTAGSAREAEAFSRDAIGKANTGEEILSRTVAAIHEIDTSAAQISGIIDVIEDIAFQTNLLALNAGVEAARAGAAGSGFAVVAVEVRELAQKTAQAAKEISGLISTSGDKVQQGVGLIGETGAALAEIVAAAERLTAKTGEISRLVGSQADGLREINAAVEQLDRTTQQNAAMFEETTTANDALAREGERLSSLVRRFHTDADGTAAGHEGVSDRREGRDGARDDPATGAGSGATMRLA